MRRVVERQVLAGLASDGHHLAFGDMVIEEEHVAAFAHTEMGRLPRLLGERAHIIVARGDEAAACVSSSEPPGGRSQHVFAAAIRVRKEAPLPKCVGQVKDIAAVDSEERRQLLERDRLRRLPDRFEDRQASIETLNRRSDVNGFAGLRVACRSTPACLEACRPEPRSQFSASRLDI